MDSVHLNLIVITTELRTQIGIKGRFILLRNGYFKNGQNQLERLLLGMVMNPSNSRKPEYEMAFCLFLKHIFQKTNFLQK
jgi:hypothetical protein